VLCGDSSAMVRWQERYAVPGFANEMS